jgi:hypothetical protein
MSFTHLGEVIDHFVVLAHHVGHLIFVSIQSAPDKICHRFLVRHHLLEKFWYCRHGAYHTAAAAIVLVLQEAEPEQSGDRCN